MTNIKEVYATDFQLNVRMGNDAMQTAEDLADALRRTADRIENQGFSSHGAIMDLNGARVGNWSIH